MIAGLAARAGATTIADIVAAPESYNGQQVTVTGTVANPSSAYLGAIIYNPPASAPSLRDIVYTRSAGALRITVFVQCSLPAVVHLVPVDSKIGWRECA